MSVLLSLIYRLSAIQIKISASYFVVIDKDIIKLNPEELTLYLRIRAVRGPIHLTCKLNIKL